MDIRYIAGLFDGEGCVSIHLRPDTNMRVGFHYSLQVSIGQKRPKVLRMIRKLFGGFLNSPNRTCRVYELMFTAQAGERFLRTVLPYLIVKRKEAEIALEFRKLMVRKNYPKREGWSRIPKRTQRRMFTLWKRLMTLPGRGGRLGKRSRKILESGINIT